MECTQVESSVCLKVCMILSVCAWLCCTDQPTDRLTGWLSESWKQFWVCKYQSIDTDVTAFWVEHIQIVVKGYCGLNQSSKTKLDYFVWSHTGAHSQLHLYTHSSTLKDSDGDFTYTHIRKVAAAITSAAVNVFTYAGKAVPMSVYWYFLRYINMYVCVHTYRDGYVLCKLMHAVVIHTSKFTGLNAHFLLNAWKYAIKNERCFSLLRLQRTSKQEEAPQQHLHKLAKKHPPPLYAPQ